MRYGLDGQGYKTLREVGAALHVSASRPHQNLYKAMRRLRYQLDFFEAFNDYLQAYPLPKEVRRSEWFTEKGLLRGAHRRISGEE